MLPLSVLLLAAAAVAHPFEIASNKPFVSVTVNGSAPQWFILDSGNNGPSLIAHECAERLKLERGADTRVQVGAGSGADVRAAVGTGVARLTTLGETLAVAEPRMLTLGHVARVEGRRVDGLIGRDFISRHVIEIDYAANRITIHDPETYTPPAGAIVVPLSLDTGWPVVEGSVTPPGGTPIPCRLIIDTGVRFTIALFRPFSVRHGLYDPAGGLGDRVVGTGMGGVSRGDIGRLDALALGARSFARPVAVISRDTTGVFALDGPDGIVGGELLRRHRVTFDEPHARMILEPYADSVAFEWDMSGAFLTTDAPDYTRIRVLSVGPKTPAAAAGLLADDEIVGIDGRRTPALRLDQARTLLRTPGTRQLEVRRGGKVLRVRLEARRMV